MAEVDTVGFAANAQEPVGPSVVEYSEYLVCYFEIIVELGPFSISNPQVLSVSSRVHP